MVKILTTPTISLLILLLAACGSKQQMGQLTLIVEGMPLQDSLELADVSKKGYPEMLRLLFVNSQDILDSYSYKGGCDTISLSSAKPFMELAVQRYMFTPVAKQMVRVGTTYTLLQIGDTVRLRYSPNGDCFFESRCFPAFTQTYNLDSRLFRPIENSAEKQIDELVFTYMLFNLQEDTTNLPPEIVHPKVVVRGYASFVRQYGQTIDSLVKAGSLPTAYEHYYHYRMGLLNARPLLIERRLSTTTSPVVNPTLTASLNDSLCNYISYWLAMNDFQEPLVRSSGNGELPRFEYIDSSGTEHHKAWAPDLRGVFDRLSDYEKDIPPHTLNLMRYICLDRIQNSAAPRYPESDKQAYLKKYRELTTDYLDFEYASLDRTAGLPFRFFMFLMEFSGCMWILFAVYLFVRKRLNFGLRRVYLLLCLLLSVVIPLVTLSAQLRLIERTESWARVFNFVTEALFCIYLLGCIYLLFELASWLWKVWRMKRDSWRIPAKDHTLCILMYEDSKPTIFGRSIFFCWDDWWHPTDRDSRDRMRDSQRYRIRKGHMFDSLLLAVMRTLCWANPLLRTYNMELQRVNDMAASHYIYANRCVNDYTATEEMQSLQSNLVYGLAGSDYQPNAGTAGRKFSGWLHGVKYQLAIFAVLLVIAALLVQLFTTIGTLSKTSLFG